MRPTDRTDAQAAGAAAAHHVRRSLAKNPSGLWLCPVGVHTRRGRGDAATDAGLLPLLSVAAGTPLNSKRIDHLVVVDLEALARPAAGAGRLNRSQGFEAARATWVTLRRTGALPDRYRGAAEAPVAAGIAFGLATIRGYADTSVIKEKPASALTASAIATSAACGTAGSL